jgi:hypothetical protein
LRRNHYIDFPSPSTTDAPSPTTATTTTTKMTDQRTLRTKPQVDMNLVSLGGRQYREMESESEHQDSGLPDPKKSTKKEKRKMPVTPDSIHSCKLTAAFSASKRSFPDFLRLCKRWLLWCASLLRSPRL